MGTFRGIVAGFLLVCVVGQAASAGPIFMPAGSTVWMEFSSSLAPLADGNNVAGSNQPGVAPPNGIPSATVTSGGLSASGYAEILPDRVRTYTVGFSQFMHASFQDTYTVGGSAAGPFELTILFRVTGEM